MQELFDIEDMYTIKYDSIKNGFNTRNNYNEL